MLDAVKPLLNPTLFLDCGAHSVETGVWSHLPIPEYTEWVVKNHNKFSIIAVPDIIGDCNQTKINTYEFIKRLEGRVPLHKIISIYHMQTKDISKFKEVLEYSEELGLSRVAIGGALKIGWSKAQKEQSLEACFKLLDRKKFKIHLLGITEPDTLQIYLPDSADSSKFIHEAKYLHIMDVDKEVRSRTRVDLNPIKFEREKVIKEFKKYWERYSDILYPGAMDDFDYITGYLTESMMCVLINGLNMVYIEKYIRNKYKVDFIHYITCNLGFFSSYKFPVDKVLQSIYQDRSLISFSYVYDLNRGGYEEKDLYYINSKHK